jgi:LysM repeat protein
LFTGEPGWVDTAGVGPVAADDGLPAVLAPAIQAAPASGSVARGTTVTCTVRPGDTLKTIASSVGVDLRALLEANPNTEPDRLAIGEPIQMPADASTASP